MEDINSKILRDGYGLKLIASAKSRGGVICKTNMGVKEIKKSYGSKNRILFESKARQHLKKNGFDKAVCYVPAENGMPYYEADGNTYVVEDCIAPQPADLGRADTLIDAAQCLCELHIASRGFCCEGESSNIGKLPSIFEKRSGELIKIKKWISAQSRLSEMDIIVLKNYKYYYEKLKEASELLKKSGYEDICKKASSEATFCHNAFKGDNIRTDGKGIFVTGFGKCAKDCCVVDLTEFIRRYMKDESADIAVIYAILERYSQKNTLSKADKKLMYAMLKYPYKFMKLCNEHYNKRRVCVSEAIVSKMKKCVSSQNRYESLLSEIERL